MNMIKSSEKGSRESFKSSSFTFLYLVLLLALFLLPIYSRIIKACIQKKRSFLPIFQLLPYCKRKILNKQKKPKILIIISIDWSQIPSNLLHLSFPLSKIGKAWNHYCFLVESKKINKFKFPLKSMDFFS